MSPMFSQNLTLQEAFETAAQINEELKKNIHVIHWYILHSIQTSN